MTAKDGLMPWEPGMAGAATARDDGLLAIWQGVCGAKVWSLADGQPEGLGLA